MGNCNCLFGRKQKTLTFCTRDWASTSFVCHSFSATFVLLLLFLRYSDGKEKEKHFLQWPETNTSLKSHRRSSTLGGSRKSYIFFFVFFWEIESLFKRQKTRHLLNLIKSMQRSSTLSHNLLLLLDRELRNNDDREIKTKKDFLFFVFLLNIRTRLEVEGQSGIGRRRRRRRAWNHFFFLVVVVVE